MVERISLTGIRTNGGWKDKRGLSIKSSNCESFAPPPHVNEKHAEIQQMIDQRKVKDGEKHGWIEHDGHKVTDWHVDNELIRE